ncbi:MAG: glycine zipper 2TM domain-containing protein [Pseudomonadota bacterium]
MRNFLMALSAASLVIPITMAVPTTKAEARKKHYTPRVYRGRDGRTYCRHSDGTTGLIVGGVGGALLGSQIAGRGDSTLGAVIGGVGGALGGRAIDRSMTANKRCR